MEPLDDISIQMLSPDASHVTEQISYAIWGSIATSCKAFDKVKINLHSDTNRVFIEVRLRWWAKIKRLEPFRRFWIKRAEAAAQEYVPNGWRLLVYYEKESTDRSDQRHDRPEGQDSGNASSGNGYWHGGRSIEHETNMQGATATDRGDAIEGRWGFSKADRRP